MRGLTHALAWREGGCRGGDEIALALAIGAPARQFRKPVLRLFGLDRLRPRLAGRRGVLPFGKPAPRIEAGPTARPSSRARRERKARLAPSASPRAKAPWRSCARVPSSDVRATAIRPAMRPSRGAACARNLPGVCGSGRSSARANPSGLGRHGVAGRAKAKSSSTSNRARIGRAPNARGREQRVTHQHVAVGQRRARRVGGQRMRFAVGRGEDGTSAGDGQRRQHMMWKAHRLLCPGAALRSPRKIRG